MRIFGGKPTISSYKTTVKQQLNGEKIMRFGIRMWCWLSCGVMLFGHPQDPRRWGWGGGGWGWGGGDWGWELYLTRRSPPESSAADSALAGSNQSFHLIFARSWLVSVTCVTDVIDVTDVTDGTDADVTDVTDITDVTDVTDITDVTDVTGVTDVTTSPTSLMWQTSLISLM